MFVPSPRRYAANVVTRASIHLFAVAGLTSIARPAIAADGASAHEAALVRGAISTLFEPGDGELGSFPGAYSIDRVGVDGMLGKRIFVAVSQNPDDPAAPLMGAFLVSDDLGATFEPIVGQPPALGTNIARLRDGTMIDVSFKATAVDGASAELAVRRSTDDGLTWTEESATLTTAAPIGGIRMHRDIFELGGGSLRMGAYIAYAGGEGYGADLLASDDRGATWTAVTIAPASATKDFNETTVAQVADGSLLAISRTAVASGTGNLAVARSDDLGATWSTPTDLQISIGGGAEGARVGVDPMLRLMPNGVLVLSAGRNDNWIAMSPDGTGHAWEAGQITYVNYPTTPGGALRTHGSSGYTGLAAVASNRLLLVGDNCANSWGCPASEGGWTVDDAYRIWQAHVDVLTPDVGKIDLARAYAAGRIEVEGNPTWTSDAHPETGLAALFDGSTAHWSSAIVEGDAAPEVDIRLDRIHELTRIGLCMRPGVPASAQVYVSDDGESWGEPVVSTGERTQYALEYFELPEPTRAGHVRIVGTSTADCGEGLDDCGMLTELELYSTIDGFENDPIDAVPRGYRDAALARTTLGDGERGDRALRITDDSDSVHAKLSRTDAPAATKRLELRVRPIALPNGFLFDVLGTDGGGATVSAYHFAIDDDGSLRHYDVASETWTPFSDPGAVPLGAWSTLRVLADLAGATVCLDGEPVATLPPSVGGITALVGHGFASAGTAPTGDDIVIDDVLFDDRSGDCAIELPPDPPDDGGTDTGPSDPDTSGGAAGDDTDTSGAALGSSGEAGGEQDGTTSSGCGCTATPQRGSTALVAMLVLVYAAARARTRREGVARRPLARAHVRDGRGAHRGELPRRCPAAVRAAPRARLAVRVDAAHRVRARPRARAAG